jgi:hypothetical protein
MRFPSSSTLRRPLLLAGALFALGFAGCFHSVSPNVDTIICQSDNNCPIGYICAVKGQPGGCRKSVAGADGSADGASTARDVVGPLDGKVADMISGEDGSVVRDAAADLVIGGQDLSTGQPDGVSPIPPDVQPDVASLPDVADAGLESRDAAPSDFPVDQPLPCNGGCCTSADCPLTAPVCNSTNQCTKCGSDNDCSGRSATACNATSGACVQCTKNSQCGGASAVCDTTANKCVGCTQRTDCPGACQTCNAGTCVAVKGGDDTSKCAGTCDANGECKAKAGQKCDAVTAGCITGTTCADGYCCNRACVGTCEACDLAALPGTCSVLPANTPARHGSCGGSGTCAGTCQGKADGTCTFPTSSCETASCATPTSTQAAGTCNAGACERPAPVSCKTGATCSGGTCSCPPGTDDCGASGCINVNASDNNHCGSCTNVCQPGQSCSLGKCACTKGAPSCGGCLAWDFEAGAGTPPDWAVGGEPNAVASGNGATNALISGAMTNPNNPSSHYSLAVPVAIYDSNMVPAAVAAPLCNAGTPINLAGYTLTAAVYLAGPAFTWTGGMHVNSYGPNGNYDWGIQMFNPLKNNDWNFLNYTFTQSILVDHVSIQLDANEYWVGTMYIDDVVIAGP